MTSISEPTIPEPASTSPRGGLLAVHRAQKDGINEVPEVVHTYNQPPPFTEPNLNMNETAARTFGTVKESTAWDVYNTEAKKIDTELIKDWRDSLNSLLLFVRRPLDIRAVVQTTTCSPAYLLPS
jgi:hypothetical protein